MTRAKSKSKARGLKGLMLFFNCILIFLLGLTYITPHIAVEHWGWLSLLALAYPFILLANVIFVIGWIFFRSWYAMLSVVAILLGTAYHQRYMQLFPAGKNKANCEESIHILTYNMRGLSFVPIDKEANYTTRVDSFYQALTDLKDYPDIICLQEAYKGEVIAKRFGLEHNYHGPKSTMWVLSRYPIIKQGFLEGQGLNPSVIWADISTPQGTLRVYNMHLISNRITHTAEELIQDMDLQNENTWSRIKFIVGRYRQTTQKRAIEAAALRKHMATSKHPAIIAGDGNDPPISHTYKVLKTGLQDSFVDKGFGLSTTYESTLPLLRIDYVFGSNGILFQNHNTHHIRYSDHYPVSASICLQTAEGS